MELRRYLAVIFLLIANILGIVYLMSSMSFITFYKEFMVVVLFMLLLVIAIYAFVFRYKYRFILTAIFFMLGIFNSIYLYFEVESFMLVLLVAANAFGFVIAINSIGAKRRKAKEKEPRLVEKGIKPVPKKEESAIIREVKEELEELKRKKEIEELENESNELKKAEKKVSEIRRKKVMDDIKREAKVLQEAEKKIRGAKRKKEYSPGRFVGSKNSNKYHAPKCEWAKRIKSKQRIWFKTEAEARKKGYSKHSCLKK